MKRSVNYLFILAYLFLFASSWPAHAQQVVTLEPAKAALPPLSLPDLLPEKLAGGKATSAITQVSGDNLAPLVAEQAIIYQEYRVTSAASRIYGTSRVDIFQTDEPFAAYGLFSYHAAEATAAAKAKVIGSASSVVADGVIFWKGRYFVKVASAGSKASALATWTSVASAIATKIPDSSADTQPPTLLGSLPKESRLDRRERYFLGAQSLNRYFARASELFTFDGEAEAVVAEYAQGIQPVPAASSAPLTRNPATSPATATPAFKLVIVEYHTPQFATQAMAQAGGYLATLSAEEQNRLIVKRVGNFIIGASGFEDRQFAEQVVGKIEYPYVVKWLQNPAIPTDDPFRLQKTATMLISTFSLIGLTGAVVLIGGTLVGTLIFIKRRKQQRAIFSDAGGMLRLQLDPVEDTMLGLLPERRTED